MLCRIKAGQKIPRNNTNGHQWRSGRRNNGTFVRGRVCGRVKELQPPALT